jgi:hypothetical protein
MLRCAFSHVTGKLFILVRFEVFTAVTMKNGVFWVVTRATRRNNPEDTILLFILVSYIVLGTVGRFFVVPFKGLMSPTSYFYVSTLVTLQ